MQKLISDCGHYVDVRSGVVECLLKEYSLIVHSMLGTPGSSFLIKKGDLS